MTAGELSTRIIIEDRILDRSENGYDSIETWHSIDGDIPWRYCRWRDSYGSEALIADQAGLERLATCIIRYTPKVTGTCRVFLVEEVEEAALRGVEARPFEVFGIHPLDSKKHWLEFKVQRREMSL